MIIPLKRKYTLPGNFKKTGYRTRTGPMCCNGNCPSTRKKGARAVKKVNR